MTAEPLLYPNTTDSHFHLLEMWRKGLDPGRLLSEAFAAGLVYALDIGISLEGFPERLEAASRFPGIRHTVGLSPAEAAKPVGGSGASAVQETDETFARRLSDMLTLLEAQAGSENVVGIGEIGLDFYWNYGTPERQTALFISQLELADRLNLPVVIHSRDADERMLAVLEAHAPRRGGVMHCFSSGPAEAEAFVGIGLYISFAGNLTYKRSDALKEAARIVPDDRLLVETDSPYLAPVPVRGRPNHPGLIGHTVRTLAELRNGRPAEIAELTTANFRALFGL